MKKIITLIFTILALSATSQNFKTVSGKVVDDRTGDKIALATLWVKNTDISVVSNGDGYFSIKIPTTTDSLWVRQLGYQPKVISANGTNITVRLTETSIMIDRITVRGDTPLDILMLALSKVKENYPTTPMNLIGFYRETTQKNDRYVAVAEAITDIYKSPIHQGVDQSKLYKGRRSFDYSRVDTIVMQYRGGLNTAMLLDIAKHPKNIFPVIDSIDFYYELESGVITQIQGRDQLVVYFRQKNNTPDILYRGTIWIDAQNYGISRMEFARNVEEKPLAFRDFVLHSPPKYAINMLEVNYLTDYIWDGKLWNYNYSKADLQMKIKSDKRKFNADYRIVSELVVTDRSNENVTKFKTMERVKSTDLIFDRIVDYLDPTFWEQFNVIEPEENLEIAVKRINRRMR